MNDRARQQRRRSKTRDRALILLLIGTVLLMPPVAPIAGIDGRIGALPIGMVYVFTVWAGLILGAALLARHLGRIDAAERDAPRRRR